MDECKIYADGTVVHYRRAKTVNAVSLANLKRGREKKDSDSDGIQTATARRHETWYSLHSKARRKLRASCVYCFVTKPRGTFAHFVTVTFSSDVPNEEHVRQTIFKKFVKNLAAYRGLYSYVAVKECGELNGLIHYHCVLVMPFVSYKKLNNDLVKIHQNSGFHGSANCFTSSSKRRSPIVRDVRAVVRYITKYMGKGGTKENGTDLFRLPVYFISTRARCEPVTCDNVAMLSRLFEPYPPLWRYVGDNFAITKHNYDVFFKAKNGDI